MHLYLARRLLLVAVLNDAVQEAAPPSSEVVAAIGAVLSHGTDRRAISQASWQPLLHSEQLPCALH